MLRVSRWRDRGFTIIELLIALLLTGVLALAAFQFYASINQQVIAQQEFADIQNLNRACLDELSTALKSAGFGLADIHPAYDIVGDSLYVFVADSAKVDTQLYFMSEFTDAEYTAKLGGQPSGMTVFNLMKQDNSGSPVVYADFLTDLRFTIINPRLVAITVEITSAIPDDTYQPNNGYRTFINTERVVVRNASS